MTDLLCGLLLLAAPAEGDVRVVLDKDRRAVRVLGIDADNLGRLRRARWGADEWAKLFAVSVDRTGAGNTPILGKYRVEGGAVVFEPEFPFARGTAYRATFRPERLPTPSAAEARGLRFTVPAPAKERPTEVVQVYPSADRLPENQLRFYLHFSAPMSRGDVYRHITLVEEGGKEVPFPFLELEQELWNPDGTRFTLFFDPGRIKRGLKPREEVGPSLVEGKKYTLVVDRAWADADGAPLKDTYRKRFSVGAPDDTCPDPKTWKLEAPAAGTTNPLTVRFPEPLDHAIARGMLWVTDATGKKVEGRVEVSAGETCWRFAPTADWGRGRYHLVADTALEDRAGNTIAQPFEVDVFRPIRGTLKGETVSLPFEVK
jgi:hypothetical protein